MSSKNRVKREENQKARESADVAHRKAVHRRFVIVVLALISAPLCVFAATKAMSGDTRKVVVSPAAANSPTTLAPATSVVTVVKNNATRTVTGTSIVSYPSLTPRYKTTSSPVNAASSYPVTPQTVIRYLPPTTPATAPPPLSKPCVHSTQQIPGGGVVPVPAGPAPTKLVVKDFVIGSGPVVKAHTTLTVGYVAVACSTGKIVDASYQHGGDSTLQLDNVIPGWQLGMPGARVGGTRLLGVPASLAYGSAGRPPIIAPNEALWFRVQVKATNVTIGVPSAPTNVHATGGVGNATLTWTPGNDNGAPITQYVISTYVNGNLQAQQTAYTTASSMTISSLTAGTSYTFKVAARNSYGVGPQSAASNAAIPT